MAQRGREKVNIGLDIGSFSIKYAVISSGREGSHKLVGFGVHPAAGSSKEKITEELNAIAGKLPDKNVNISISGPSVVVRYILLPSMKREELANSMQFEAEKYIPFNINEVILDHQILEPNVAGGKMRVLLVAAKKDAIEDRVKLLQEAHFSVNIIDVDSFALINAFCLNNPDAEPEKVNALLNIGEGLSSIDIIRGNLSYFSRDFLVGGKDITRAISEKLNIDIETARKLKHDPGDRAGDVAEINRSVLSSMADEIRLSLSYYENQFGSGVDGIFLSGGGSQLKGIAQFFSESLGINCQLWDPAKVLAVADTVSAEELEKVKPELAVAIGLALRE